MVYTPVPYHHNPFSLSPAGVVLYLLYNKITVLDYSITLASQYMLQSGLLQ